MPILLVKKLPNGDNGRLLVRLNCKHRDGVKRYGIAKIINNANKKSQIVLILGHDNKTSIFMPYDIRTALGVSKPGEKLEFSIKKSWWGGRLYWYVSSPDPAVSRGGPIILTS